MGVVYLAEQVTPIRRRVALKLIKHGMDTRRVIARFEAERQALALMHHPHIAAVFDAGTTGDGRPFFVMEYVEGVPITDFCDRHRLSTRARLELFVQVCAAVQHAHQKGVIHRDLKPSNVLVSDADGRPLPKIIDFGVARAIDRSLTGRTAFTEQGTMVGTPEYMSPEQAALSDDIDTTTDVYSLGVLLYELLVGTLPFDPKELRAAGYDEMRRMIRESDPPKPSSRLTGGLQAADAAAVAVARQTDAGRLTRQLKGDLDWITLKALEKDRRQRYATVAAFAADVAHYLADEPIAARAPSAVYRMRKFTRRYRGAVLGAAAVFLALVAGLAASITQYVRAEGQRVEADHQRAQAELQRTAAEAAALEAATQRYAALGATDEANRLRIVATNEAASAINARGEADYRAYTSTIAAADGELRLNLAGAARTRLLAVPNELRGWEWHHLFLKADPSLVTLGSPAACDKYNLNSGAGVSLALQDGGARINLSRCATLDTWRGATHAHTRRSFAENRAVRVLAVGQAGQVLVAHAVEEAGRPPVWEARLVHATSNETVGRAGPFTAAPICADISADAGHIAIGLLPEFGVGGEPRGDLFETWDVRTAQRLARMISPKPQFFDSRYRNPVMCQVAFSPDATLVASSGATVQVWRSDSGAAVASDPIQSGTIRQPVAFDRDGSRLAIGRLTGLVDILSLSSTPRLDSLDGSRFVRVPTQQAVTILERRNLVEARRRSEVSAVAFSPDGSRVISGTDVSVGIWDVQRQKLVDVLAGHDAAVISIAVAADGRIMTADASGVVRVWGAQASSAVTVLPGFGEYGGEIALSPDGSMVGIGQLDGGISAWRLADLQRIVVRATSGRLGDPPPARPVLVTPDLRHMLVSTDYDILGHVTWWSLSSSEKTAVPMNASPEPGCESPEPRRRGVRQMALRPDGRVLAFNQGDCVVVQDLPTQRRLATLHQAPTALLFHPDGSLLVRTRVGTPRTGEAATSVVRWDWHANRVGGQTPIQTKTASSQAQFAVSPDGRRIAIVGGSPSIVSMWDGSLRRELGRLPAPPNTVSVAFSPDGRRIATTASDTTIRIWDADRHQLLLILSDEDAHLGGIAFTPDGRLIAGRSGGGLTIWETRKKQAPSPHP
jgi:WD40 repeat protein